MKSPPTWPEAGADPSANFVTEADCPGRLNSIVITHSKEAAR